MTTKLETALKRAGFNLTITAKPNAFRVTLGPLSRRYSDDEKGRKRLVVDIGWRLPTGTRPGSKHFDKAIQANPSQYSPLMLQLAAAICDISSTIRNTLNFQQQREGDRSSVIRGWATHTFPPPTKGSQDRSLKTHYEALLLNARANASPGEYPDLDTLDTLLKTVP